MKTYVAGFVFSHSGIFVLLIRKQKPDWQKGLLNGIGGKVEGSEFNSNAMIREFKEEVGDFQLDWNLRLTLHHENDWKVHFYSAFTDSSRMMDMVPGRGEHGEITEIIETTRILSRGDVIPNLKWIIPYCLNKDNKYNVIKD